MKVDLECKYCGFREITDIWGEAALKYHRCSKCKDKNFFVRDPNNPKVDYYKDDTQPNKDDSDPDDYGGYI